MTLLGNMRPLMDITYGLYLKMKMSELSFLGRISAYVTERKLIATLEAKYQEMMYVKATMFEVRK